MSGKIRPSVLGLLFVLCFFSSYGAYVSMSMPLFEPITPRNERHSTGHSIVKR